MKNDHFNDGRGASCAPNILSDTVKSASSGNWPWILTQLGIPARFLDGRNQSCPACGGDDRFQFTVRGAGVEYGRFACRGMDSQGGDGFALVMHAHSLKFNEALRAVARVLGISTDGGHTALVLPTIAKPEPVPMVDNSEKVQGVFDSCVTVTQQSIAGRYLINRGIAARHWPEPHTSPLRHCNALDYWQVVDNKPVKLGVFPALVARIQKPDDSLSGIHRIYLNEHGAKLVLQREDVVLPNKLLKKAHEGALRGAACRLYPVGNDGRLALTEGIETALAVHCLTGLAVWACISAGGLKNVVLPESVREVLIYADNDEPDHNGKNTGKEAAYILAARLVSEGRKVKVLLPPTIGTDWLDYLNDEMNRCKA